MTLFEVGKVYDIEIYEDEGEDGETIATTHANLKIVEVDGPLIKVRSTGSSIQQAVIINTHSPAFIRAMEIDIPDR
jgi:hypothetical protein